MRVTTIGMDLAKNIFQVHGIASNGEVAFNRSARRAQVLPFFEGLECCLIGMEACGTSHHWARELSQLGHEVRLIPPAYVKPFVKRGKSTAQQAVLFLHRARDLIVRQRTQLINMMRGMRAEFGIVTGQGIGRAVALAEAVVGGELPDLPEVAQEVIANLGNQLIALDMQVRWHELRLRLEAKRDERIELLRSIPGVGLITASAIVATVGSARQFRNGREFTEWLGLTPLNRSSGGKERLGRITKMGDRYLRRLLIIGMTARVRQVKSHPTRSDPWTDAILERKPIRLATVAMANRTARTIWAMLTRNERFQPCTA